MNEQHYLREMSCVRVACVMVDACILELHAFRALPFHTSTSPSNESMCRVKKKTFRLRGEKGWTNINGVSDSYVKVPGPILSSARNVEQNRRRSFDKFSMTSFENVHQALNFLTKELKS